MRIADLFVNIGVKGADKTASALGNVKTSMGDVASTSLAAKAAIAGVLYGLERLMSESGHVGTGLTQFANLTGLSADRLQRWQYLALQSGESAEEMTSSIEGVQKAMTKMLLGQGAPAGINALKNLVGFDASKARDTFYVLDKLREYARKTKDTPDVANEILGSFGISPTTIQALRSSSVKLDEVDPSRMYSKGQIARLNKVNIAWANLGDKITHQMGRLNSKFGPSLVKDISGLADQVLKLVDAFGSLAEKLELVSGFGKIFEGWSEIFKLAGEGVNKINGKDKSPFLPDSDTLKVFIHSLLGDPMKVPASPRVINNHVNAHVTVHGVHDAHEVPKHVNKMINDAARQFPQGGGY